MHRAFCYKGRNLPSRGFHLVFLCLISVSTVNQHLNWPNFRSVGRSRETLKNPGGICMVFPRGCPTVHQKSVRSFHSGGFWRILLSSCLPLWIFVLGGILPSHSLRWSSGGWTFREKKKSAILKRNMFWKALTMIFLVVQSLCVWLFVTPWTDFSHYLFYLKIFGCATCMWDPSSMTRDWTYTFCSGSMKS